MAQGARCAIVIFPSFHMTQLVEHMELVRGNRMSRSAGHLTGALLLRELLSVKEHARTTLLRFTIPTL